MTTTHSVTSLASIKGLPINYIVSPDLMEIIERTTPGKDGLSILYTVAGGLDMRIARLAGMVTNAMAGLLRAGEPDQYGVMPPTIDSFNDAVAALEGKEARTWALEQTGITQKDMTRDLRELLGFRATVADRITALTGRRHESRWAESIAMAATPMAVEKWKLDLSWGEYVEGCHGETLMLESEFRSLKETELTGKAQTWKNFIPQVIDTIEAIGADNIEGTDFEDMNAETQLRLLESISTDDKETKMKKNALKLARSPEDLHTRRLFLSSFMVAARKACSHQRFASVIQARAAFN